MNDTMAGQTQVMFPSLFSAYPHVKGGKLRALALAGPKRSSLLPDVPTLEEAGIKGVEITQWYALFAPGKTPRPVIDLLFCPIEREHCYRAYLAEQRGRQLPKEYRP